MQKRASKLADLVCTKEFFLYKSGQISNKCESDFLVCYLFLLATVWTRDKRGQMPPNDTKRKWLLLMQIMVAAQGSSTHCGLRQKLPALDCCHRVGTDSHWEVYNKQPTCQNLQDRMPLAISLIPSSRFGIRILEYQLRPSNERMQSGRLRLMPIFSPWVGKRYYDKSHKSRIMLIHWLRKSNNMWSHERTPGWLFIYIFFPFLLNSPQVSTRIKSILDIQIFRNCLPAINGFTAFK